MRIYVSKTKVMSPRIPGEQRQAVLLDGEPFEVVDKFKYLDSMFDASTSKYPTPMIHTEICLKRQKWRRSSTHGTQPLRL